MKCSIPKSVIDYINAKKRLAAHDWNKEAPKGDMKLMVDETRHLYERYKQLFPNEILAIENRTK